VAKYDTDELLATVKRRGLIPANQVTFADADFLKDCSNELESSILPALVELRGEFLLATKSYAITANQATYRVPSRATGGTIRRLHILGSDGSIRELEERDQKEIARLGLNTAVGTPCFYVFDGAYIRLYPTPATTVDTLVVTYPIAPNRLVTVASVGRITGISVDRTVLTISGANSNLATATVFDICRSTPHFDHLEVDLTGTYATGGSTTVTFGSAVNSEIVVGDWVCVAGETASPQIPKELHICIGLRAASSALAALGDAGLSKKLLDEADAKEKKLYAMLKPRNKAAVPDITNDWWF
jgi:hypothetical protein